MNQPCGRTSGGTSFDHYSPEVRIIDRMFGNERSPVWGSQLRVVTYIIRRMDIKCGRAASALDSGSRTERIERLSITGRVVQIVLQPLKNVWIAGRSQDGFSCIGIWEQRPAHLNQTTSEDCPVRPSTTVGKSDRPGVYDQTAIRDPRERHMRMSADDGRNGNGIPASTSSQRSSPVSTSTISFSSLGVP